MTCNHEFECKHCGERWPRDYEKAVANLRAHRSLIKQLAEVIVSKTSPTGHAPSAADRTFMSDRLGLAWSEVAFEERLNRRLTEMADGNKLTADVIKAIEARWPGAVDARWSRAMGPPANLT